MERPGWIHATYENITSRCRNCGSQNVHNRASEIGHTAPISHATVACERCAKVYDVCGDLINPPFELLLLDATAALSSKDYTRAILLASTASEMFFAHILKVELVYRTDRRDRVTPRDSIDWLNATSGLLAKKTRYLAFGALRAVALRLMVDMVRPSRLADSVKYIETLPSAAVTDAEIQSKGFGCGSIATGQSLTIPHVSWNLTRQAAVFLVGHFGPTGGTNGAGSRAA